MIETITEEGQKRYRQMTAAYQTWEDIRSDEARNVLSSIRLLTKGGVFAPVRYKMPAGPYPNA